MSTEAIAAALGALLAGAVVAVALLARDRRRLGADADRTRSELHEAEAEAARLAERLAAQERLAAEREASLIREREALEKRFAEMNELARGQFERVAGETLDKSQQRFLELARQAFARQQSEGQAELDKRRRAVEDLVKPIGETLSETRERLTRLQEQTSASREASELLRQEASKLVRALSRPDVRGRYGEIQLRRVAELAGMTSYCDFSEQHSVRDDDGQLQRPDMVVKLPNARLIAVDAKCPTDAYMQAMEADTTAGTEELMEKFAAAVVDQMRKLSDKKYWAQFEGSPEFVVMFVPGDQFVDAALARRPDLIERAAEANVILASPSTLIGLLRAVAVGWREHRIAESAEELFGLGRQLHERAVKVFEHASSLGDNLLKAVQGYNRMVGSIDNRLVPTLRRFEEAGASGIKRAEQPTLIDLGPRQLQAGAEEDE